VTKVNGKINNASKLPDILNLIASKNPISKAVTPNSEHTAWAKYQERQNHQADLRYDAYHHDHSIHDDPMGPVVPIYGRMTEFGSHGGDLFPTGPLVPVRTAADMRKVEMRVRQLENGFLYRQYVCPICNEDLATGTFGVERTKQHFQSHIDALKINSQCPICHTKDWESFNQAKRAEHLRTHEIIPLRNTVFRCPVDGCRFQLGNGFNTDQIVYDTVDHYLRHMAAGQNGADKKKNSSYCRDCRFEFEPGLPALQVYVHLITARGANRCGARIAGRIWRKCRMN